MAGTVTNMNELLPLVTTAATQSDRWLFLLATGFSFLGFTIAIRWLVSEFRNITTEVARVMQKNTDTLEDVRDVMRNCGLRQGRD